MKRFVTAVLAAGFVALVTLPDLASGVASSPPECPACDCSSEASYLGGRSAPVAIPVPEEYEEVVSARDYPAHDGYPQVASYEDYASVDPYDEYAAAEAYPIDLEMGYGDYGL